MSKKKRVHSTILDSNSEELRRAAADRANGVLTEEYAVKKDRPAAGAYTGTGTHNKKASSTNSHAIYLLFVVGISIVFAVFIMFRGVLNINEGLTSELTVYETSLSGVADGAYSGTYSTAHMSAKVSVAVVSERISAIYLDGYAGIDPERAKTVIETIIRYQALNAPDDSIGNEYTDKIIQRAVMDALYNAVQESVQDQPENISSGDATARTDPDTALPAVPAYAS